MLDYLHVQLHHWEHYSRLWCTLFMPNHGCEELYISAKIQLLVDFTPFALHKTISNHFLEIVTLVKWFTCIIKSLWTLIQTVAYIIHAKPRIWRSVHFGKNTIISWFYAKIKMDLVYSLHENFPVRRYSMHCIKYMDKDCITF